MQTQVLGGQSMACGSMRAGEMEFMLHRNLQQDDGRGNALHWIGFDWIIFFD